MRAELPALLAAWDIADWIELYGRDLGAIYETADEAKFLLPPGLPFSDFYPWNARFARGLVGQPGRP